MIKKHIIVHMLAIIAVLVPVAVFAHGGIDDGHVEGVVTKASGSSALLEAFSLQWWGLLVVATLLTSALSFGVWKFLSVSSVKKSDVKSATPVIGGKK